MSRCELRVELGERSYPIHIGAGLLDEESLYAPHVRGRAAAVVTNETVAPLYATRVEAALARAGAHTLRIVLPDGEAYKDWQHLDRIFAALLEARFDRAGVLVAVGGGVVGDMAGFAAAAYQRGIAHLQVPTTLLAQVDSSVGGKTAINHPLGKNMIGAFHQPAAVIADTASLATLPPREYAAGLAEVVKYGAIHDLGFLEWIEAHAEELTRRDPGALAHAIARSCEIKAQIVAADERESGARALLNFGHTFGHALEAEIGFSDALLHGEAVAAGMALAAGLSARMGRIPQSHARRLVALLERFGLPVEAPSFPVETWLTYMGRDKKNERGRITLVLLDALGRASVVRDAPEQALRELLAGA
jgi:3-dehydroquinate synthase